jgi:hypothetical protein
MIGGCSVLQGFKDTCGIGALGLRITGNPAGFEVHWEDGYRHDTV